MMQYNVLIVDDEAGTLKLLGSVISDVAKVRVATNGRDALRLAHELVPDLILLDAEMPDMTGFEVFETLQTDPELADVPVIFITSHSEAAFEVAGLEMGAADYIAKPVNPPIVLARVKTQLRIKGLTEELRRASRMDPLTGAPNRRHFDRSLEQEWLRARRCSEPISLLLINVDQFTLFNSQYGHHAGDECLRTIAQALAIACRRPADIVARYSGKEFMLLLPQTDREGAEHVARRVLDAMEALRIPHVSSPIAKHATVSIGVAFYDSKSKHWVDSAVGWRSSGGHSELVSGTHLIKTAVVALSLAKRSGRARARSLGISEYENAGSAHDIVATQIDHVATESV